MSNFSRHPVTVFGRTWPTSEHAFQGCKPVDPAIREAIHRSASPAKAAALGRTNPMRADWERTVTGSRLGLVPGVLVKDTVMYDVVKAKFQQHADIREALLATGDAQLIEAAVHDPYWGEGCSHTGLNKLGQILMLVRAELSG
jgi:ribA/ribD-fused uncharacterized protein